MDWSHREPPPLEISLSPGDPEYESFHGERGGGYILPSGMHQGERLNEVPYSYLNFVPNDWYRPGRSQEAVEQYRQSLESLTSKHYMEYMVPIGKYKGSRLKDCQTSWIEWHNEQGSDYCRTKWDIFYLAIEKCVENSKNQDAKLFRNAHSPAADSDNDNHSSSSSSPAAEMTRDKKYATESLPTSSKRSIQTRNRPQTRESPKTNLNRAFSYESDSGDIPSELREMKTEALSDSDDEKHDQVVLLQRSTLITLTVIETCALIKYTAAPKRAKQVVRAYETPPPTARKRDAEYDSKDDTPVPKSCERNKGRKHFAIIIQLPRTPSPTPMKKRKAEDRSEGVLATSKHSHRGRDPRKSIQLPRTPSPSPMKKRKAEGRPLASISRTRPH